MTGRWVMVCGPSGAGKDSVLGWAHHALRGHARVVFARRLVTRAGEANVLQEPVEPVALEALKAGGRLAWHWQAHGLHYGIRAEYEEQVRRGGAVVVNGSREHVRPLLARADVRCVLVSAPPTLLEARLWARGRESVRAVEQRLDRNARLTPPAAHRVIRNDTTIEAAGSALRDYLLELVR